MIEPKEKPCDGTGKAKGYGCRKMTKHRVYGLGKMCCYSDWLLNSENGKIKLEKARITGKKKFEKEKKKESREEKSLNQDWGKKLQTEINSIVRTIDKGLTCLARNQRGQIHAGHVFARGGNQTIKYNLHNIHRQSAQSNHHQNDDGKLREGLVNEYGQEYMDFISSLRRTPALKLNNVEYRELTNKARIILKNLKLADKIYNKSERIEMRNRINFELLIYNYKFCEFKK